MDDFESFKRFVIMHGLPRSDFSLFGLSCPYCGKSDRIRRLEPPDETAGILDTAANASYLSLWQAVNPGGAPLCVCKFCQNILRMDGAGRAASMV